MDQPRRQPNEWSRDNAQEHAGLAAVSRSEAGKPAGDRQPAIPAYLRDTYWWAYLHPNAIRIFEREWLVNLILWGNMSRLTDAVLDDLTVTSGQQVLQLACVYGRFSDRVAGHLAKRGATLHLLDIAAIQLQNARRKLAHHRNVRFHHQDASALSMPSNSYDNTLLFFLLHEQPEDVRRQTLAEAIRVTRPGGKVVIVDYHGPGSLNPWRYLMFPVLHWLEPYALDLWRRPIAAFLSSAPKRHEAEKRLYFGGLYQKTVLRITR